MTSSIDMSSQVAMIELFARYCHSVDHGEADAWAALFTADGIFEIVGLMRLEEPSSCAPCPRWSPVNAAASGDTRSLRCDR